MKPLIFTISCKRDRERHRAIEYTWLKEWGRYIDHMFVLGDGCGEAQPGELVFNVPDDYGHVPYKHQFAIRWAAREGYDYVFMSDIDTYIAVPRLLRSGYEKHDFIGARCDEGHPSGGAGYWLSKKCFMPLVRTNPTGHSWSDMWTGTTLERAGIRLHDDRRYASSASVIPTTDEWNSGIISVHLGRAGGFDTTVMYSCHESYLRSTKCDQ